MTLSGVPLTFVYSGNTGLKPEGITSYEMGYRGPVAERATVGLNLFYNEYSDITFVSKEVAFYGANELFPGSPGGVIPKQISATYTHGGNALGVGGELDLNVLVADWLSLFANYSYQRITDKDDNPYTISVNEKDRVRHNTPENKVNAGMRMKFRNGLSLNLLADWVGGSERLINDFDGNEYLAKVDTYTIVNVRAGYTFRKGNAEASLYAFNIFNNGHYEYPPGINLPERSSDEIGRKIVFKVGYRF